MEIMMNQVRLQKRKGAWPFFIIAIIFIFFAGMVVTFYLASREGLQLVDADYYEQGKNYEHSSRRNRSAGHQALKMVMATVDRGLAVTVTDGSGKAPVNGEARYFASESDHGAGIMLTEMERGIYLLPLSDIDSSGRGRIVVTVGDAVVTEKIRVIGR
jgi:hypothetical protein